MKRLGLGGVQRYIGFEHSLEGLVRRLCSAGTRLPLPFSVGLGTSLMVVKLLIWTFVRLEMHILSHASDVIDDAVVAHV